MNRLLLRISCCSVGQAPAHQPVPRVGSVGGQSSINCLSLIWLGKSPPPQPALRARPNQSELNIYDWEFLVLQLGKLPPTNPPPGGGQIDQRESFIIDDFLLLGWASPRPLTRPQGAAKSVWVKCLWLRIPCCSVGQAPAHQSAPRGQPNWSKWIVHHWWFFAAWLGKSPPPPQAALRGRPNRSELNVYDWEFLVVQLGKLPPTNPPPGGGQIDQSELFIIDDLLLLSWASPRPQGAAKSVEVNRSSLTISCCSVGQAPAHQPAPRVVSVGGQSSINCLSFMICCCLVGQVPAPQPALRGRPNWSKWNIHH